MLHKNIFEHWYKNNMIDFEFNYLNTNDINNIFRLNSNGSEYKEKPVQSAYRGFIGGFETKKSNGNIDFQKAVNIANKCNRPNSSDIFIGEFNLTVFHELTANQ